MAQQGKARLAWGAGLLGLLMGIVMVGASLASVAAAPAAAPVVLSKVDRNTAGDPNAKVKIVLYYDFECPHCQRLYFDVENQLIQRYVATGKAYIEARPLDLLGPVSLKAATAVMAAADQNRFWDYQAALWDSSRVSGPAAFTDGNLKQIASQLGLNRDQFDAGLNSSAKTAQIKAFDDQAKAQGVTAVPRTFINGLSIEGEAPLQEFTTMIDQELAK